MIVTATMEPETKEEKSEERAAFSLPALPPELLLCIAVLLDSNAELLVFRSVCRDWSSIGLEVLQKRKGFCRPCPLVLLPCPDDREEPFFRSSDDRLFCPWKFFSIPDGRFLNSLAKTMRAKWVAGSSHGWLVLLDRNDTFGSDVELWNPFSNSCIRLPPPARAKGTHLALLGGGINTAILSNAPDASGGSGFRCMAAIASRSGYLAICRIGDTHWTSLPTMSYDKCHSMIFREGRLYAAFHHHTKLHCCWPVLMVFDFLAGAANGELLVKRFEAPIPLLVPPPVPKMVGSSFLVESLGELLFIHHLSLFGIDSGLCLVFRLDRQGRSWAEVHDIGDRVVFLGKNHSVSLPSSHIPGWKANCIYLADSCGLMVVDLPRTTTSTRLNILKNTHWALSLFWVIPSELASISS